MSMTSVWDYDEQLDTGSDLVGYDVEATDGSIGKIDKASMEAGRRHLVVDTGWWIFGQKRLVPAGVVSAVEHQERKVHVAMSKDQIKDAPPYEEEHGDEYYEAITGYYGAYGPRR